MALERNAPPKPLRGSALLEHRQRRAELSTHERKEMDAAKRRDLRKCRWPVCEFATKRLSIHAAHLDHRGMGGNPKGDRTTRDRLISFCARHHNLFDLALIGIDPKTARGTDGPCDFYVMSHDGTKRTLYASETSIHVSVMRDE